MVKLKQTAAVCLLAAMLSGCQQPAPTPVTQPTTAPTTTPTQPTAVPTDSTEPSEEPIPVITEPSVPADPQLLDPVTKLQCTKWVTFPQLLSLGSGQVAASRNYYDKSKKDYVNSLQLLDLYADQIIAQVDADTTLELVQQRFPDGHILTADPHGLQFLEFDEALNPVNQFSVPNTDGFFSPDRQQYYYVDGGILCRMEPDSGKRGQLALNQDLRFERLVGVHPTENLLIARVYTDDYSDNCALAVIDGDRCMLRLLSGKLANLWTTGDCFYGVAMNDTAYGMDVYCGTFSGDSVTRIDAAQIGDDQMGWSVLPGSHILVRRFNPDKGAGSTHLFDLKQGTTVNLDDYGYPYCTFGTVWLHEEQLIMGFYEVGDYFYPVLLDPKAMDFQPGVTGEAAAWPGNVDETLLAGQTAPDAGLEELRQRADLLETQYQIRILMGQQIEDGCAHARRSAQTATDPTLISAALDILETELARYPEGFFRTFRSRDNRSGVQFLLTGAISGSLPTAGFTSLLRDRYVIGLDITGLNLESTVHHELWHAAEMVLSTDRFAGAAWDKLNPENYRYYEKYDSGYLDLTKWTLSGGSGTKSHFVDSYSRISPREDRARIWETLMISGSADLLSAPVLKDKLSLMVTVLGEVFPTDPWNQYQ